LNRGVEWGGIIRTLAILTVPRRSEGKIPDIAIVNRTKRSVAAFANRSGRLHFPLFEVRIRSDRIRVVVKILQVVQTGLQ